MNANHSVTATFNANMQAELLPGGTAFASLQVAYNAAANGNTINAQAYTFQESLNLTKPISVSLNGGFMDSSYLTVIGMTGLNGSLTIGQGTLNVNNIILE
jgi:hypothetical protein